jgi:Icc-related predicted phosphoesterase
MRIACLSDTHELHRSISNFPAADIFLFAGDFTNLGEMDKVLDFNEWLGELPYQIKIVICGNHELNFDNMDKKDIKNILTNAIYLDQEMVEINGIKIWGEPRQPEFYNWAFNIPRKEMKDCWKLVPHDVDILLTHGPPLNFGDRNYCDENVGCYYMNQMIKNNKIPIVICGHIHEARGFYTMNQYTSVLNVSAVKEDMSETHTNPIVVFEYNKEKK